MFIDRRFYFMQPYMETQTPSLKTVQRNPYVAALLSICIPGLGSIYTGQLKKGLIIYLFFALGLLILFRLIGLYSYFFTLVLTVTIALGIRIYEIVNVFTYTRKQPHYVLKAYNEWYVYVGLTALLYVAYLIMTLMSEHAGIGTHTFSITTPSMEPTLQVGDRIVINFSAPNESIKRGDIVGFRPDPTKNETWVSRVVVMPDDTFELKNDFLLINGNTTNVRELPTRVIDYEPHLTFEETLIGGRVIKIHKIETRQGRVTEVPPIVVPKDSVVMISDNRDNALDSRYLGLMPKKAITGKVLFTFWGKKPNRIGINLTNQ
ncbi:hypothetical protein BH09BAC4_BH09BAC4_21420 [soil metagenome]